VFVCVSACLWCIHCSCRCLPRRRRFEEYLGEVLQMASTTFLEIPDWTSLLMALDMVAPAAASDAKPTDGDDEAALPSHW